MAATRKSNGSKDSGMYVRLAVKCRQHGEHSATVQSSDDDAIYFAATIVDAITSRGHSVDVHLCDLSDGIEEHVPFDEFMAYAIKTLINSGEW